MLNKMSMLLAATAVVAASAASAQPMAGDPQMNGPAAPAVMSDQSQSFQNGYNYGYDDGVAPATATPRTAPTPIARRAA